MKKIFFILLTIAQLIYMNGISLAEIITGTEISIHFESAIIIGTGRNINMHRVPVIDTSTGDVAYFDVSFRFSLDNKGELIFDRISSASVSPPLSSSNLIPGNYEDESGYSYVLTEPSFLSDGRSLYVLRGTGYCAFSAQIVTGEAEGHPDIGNREIAPHLSSTYIYGIITDQESWYGNMSDTSYLWLENQLIGLRQSDNTLAITLFSEGVNSSGEPQDYNSQRAAAVLHQVTEN